MKLSLTFATLALAVAVVSANGGASAGGSNNEGKTSGVLSNVLKSGILTSNETFSNTVAAIAIFFDRYLTYSLRKRTYDKKKYQNYLRLDYSKGQVYPFSAGSRNSDLPNPKILQGSIQSELK
ncbi:hypothetical protein BJV82DRAFT_582909 [Fennellomyces sp. T-0311]|nr:hypothetical protein BJV82DRAFT_582909 [Fennellomyces sp. T-0311]